MRVGQVRKRDTNEPAIVAALEQVGAVVFRLNAPGCPDLLVGWRGTWLPMEVKTPTGTLTRLQWASWQGNPYPIVTTVQEALFAMGITC